jgi:mono/diheme cytochrome c family protein
MFLQASMREPTFLLLSFVVALALPPAGIAADADSDVPPPDKSAGVDLRDPAVIEKGMQMLNSTCGGYCHGTAGRGYKGPPLRNRPDLTADGMLATIKYGRKRAGKLMPGWNGTLSEQEMWTVIAAIVSLRYADGEAGAGSKGAGH